MPFSWNSSTVSSASSANCLRLASSLPMARIASMAFSSILAWGGWPALKRPDAMTKKNAGQPPHAKIDEKAMDAMRAMGKELASLKQFALEAEETVDEFHESGRSEERRGGKARR